MPDPITHVLLIHASGHVLVYDGAGHTSMDATAALTYCQGLLVSILAKQVPALGSEGDRAT